MMKKVLVTGASRGIGRAIAQKLVSEGYEVYGTSRSAVPSAEGDGIRFVRMEASDSDSIRECHERVGDIDILINNAGRSQVGAAEDIPMERYRDLLEVNFFAPVQLTRLFLPAIRENRGFILNIGSLAASFNVPFYSGYVASKAALSGFTHSLSIEMAPFGVRVALIEPNDIRTDIRQEAFLPAGSAYHDAAQTAYHKMRGNEQKAEPPAIVADLVSKLLKKKKLRPYYALGGNAGLLLGINRFLPKSLLNKALRKMYT